MQPTGKMVKAARIKLGKTQAEMAERFGYSVGGWIKKEHDHRPMASSEFEFLLLLADMHPDLQLHDRNAKRPFTAEEIGLLLKDEHPDYKICKRHRKIDDENDSEEGEST
ncbi:helix-turn-helix domain-containing protein [Nissabacter sp. SGAir0207]|uniref:helix-turn-helix domain-containing protein n=1 Tax=Nissabacter sp. SGAir0207 TaxID=2126321 RepID=UPI001F0EFB27|nr:helix-turn-helix domain-containing protein [Nissabacter sp. SGAir0207]